MARRCSEGREEARSEKPAGKRCVGPEAGGEAAARSRPAPKPVRHRLGALPPLIIGDRASRGTCGVSVNAYDPRARAAWSTQPALSRPGSRRAAAPRSWTAAVVGDITAGRRARRPIRPPRPGGVKSTPARSAGAGSGRAPGSPSNRRRLQRVTVMGWGVDRGPRTAHRPRPPLVRGRRLLVDLRGPGMDAVRRKVRGLRPSLRASWDLPAPTTPSPRLRRARGAGAGEPAAGSDQRLSPRRGSLRCGPDAGAPALGAGPAGVVAAWDPGIGSSCRQTRLAA
jgi:hypothetical protein